MPQVDFHARQLTLKLVYYGPPRSGKTTNLRVLHQRLAAASRGRLMTLDTQDDRTVFFDLLPVVFHAGGVSVRLKVYTVPGQPVHEWTRRLVLQQADAVVFVADSGEAQAAANRESWDGLQRHLSALRIADAPIVVQYNKRDVADRVSMAQAERFAAAPPLEAVACTGVGVVETFDVALGRTWDGADQALRLGERLAIGRAEFVAALRAEVDAAPGRAATVLASTE